MVVAIFKTTLEKSVLVGFVFVFFWLLLIYIEILYGFIDLLKLLYFVFIFGLYGILIRTNVKHFQKSPNALTNALKYMLAPIVVGSIYVFIGVILGVNFKFLLGGSM